MKGSDKKKRVEDYEVIREWEKYFSAPFAVGSFNLEGSY